METNTAVISQPYSLHRTFAKLYKQGEGWLKAATTALTFQTLLRQYAEQVLIDAHGMVKKT